MKIKKILFIILIFTVGILINNICFAKDIDQINKYYITVDPRNDGTLDMTYHIEWEVLEDTSVGPLTWVEIGIPNKNVDSIKALSSNIKKIQYSSDNGAYILIDFKNEYNKGDVVTFDFSFHQKYMYTLNSSYCKYSFTPGWFDEIEVKDIKVYWNATNVYSSSAQETNSDNYLVWSGRLAKGAKMKTEVTYQKSAFTSVSENMQQGSYSSEVSNSFDSFKNIMNVLVIFIIIVFVLSAILSCMGTGYNSHRGYGYGRYGCRHIPIHHHHSSRSSCVSSRSCVSSCACACACAGGGRAGCSKKDFYGTNLRTNDLNKILKK